MYTLGDKLSQLLKENNMTQRELAEKINTTEISISRYVRNERKPKYDVVTKMAAALKTTSDEILGITRVRSDEEEFQNIHRLIARNASKMTAEEKNELIATLLKK